MKQKTVSPPVIIACAVVALLALGIVFFKMNRPQASGSVSPDVLREKQSTEAQDKADMTSPHGDYSKRNDH